MDKLISPASDGVIMVQSFDDHGVDDMVDEEAHLRN
jgi:hypothetical protein